MRQVVDTEGCARTLLLLLLALLLLWGDFLLLSLGFSAGDTEAHFTRHLFLISAILVRI